MTVGVGVVALVTFASAAAEVAEAAVELIAVRLSAFAAEMIAVVAVEAGM